MLFYYVLNECTYLSQEESIKQRWRKLCQSTYCQVHIATNSILIPLVINPFYLMSCWHSSTNAAAVTKTIPATIEWQSTIKVYYMMSLQVRVTERQLGAGLFPDKCYHHRSHTTQPHHCLSYSGKAALFGLITASTSNTFPIVFIYIKLTIYHSPRHFSNEMSI